MTKTPVVLIMPGAVLVIAKAHLAKHHQTATVDEIAQELRLPVAKVRQLAGKLVEQRLATMDSEGHVRPVLLSDSQALATWEIEKVGGKANV